MSFLGLYKINKLNGSTRYMSAKQIYKRILKDSYSEKEWMASVPEIIRICEEADFPKEYAEKIKICILKYFANVEINKKEKLKCHMQIGTNTALKDCYNSMRTSKNQNVICAREKYFEAILKSVIRGFDTLQIPSRFDPKYKQICNNWKQDMFEEYFEKQPIKDIEKMKRIFKIELHDTLKKSMGQEIFKQAEEKGIIYSKTDDNKQNPINKER